MPKDPTKRQRVRILMVEVLNTQKLPTSGLPRTHVNIGIVAHISVSPDRTPEGRWEAEMENCCKLVGQLAWCMQQGPAREALSQTKLEGSAGPTQKLFSDHPTGIMACIYLHVHVHEHSRTHRERE